MMNRNTPQYLERGWTDCRRFLTDLVQDRSGASMIFTALALPVILGMAGLGFDSAIWYMEKRQNQTVADNAALTATMELNRDPTLTEEELKDIVWEDALRNGYSDTVARNIRVFSPPQQGPNKGQAGFIEVLVEEDRDLYLTSFMLDGPLTVQSRAVGAVVQFGSHCIIALDEAMDRAVMVSGNAEANVDCGIASNSDSDESIYVDGKATLTADPAQTYGDITVTANATLDTNSPPQSLSERVADPYADRFLDPDFIPPLSGACKGVANPVDITGNVTLNPNFNNTNAFCGGLDIKANADVFFNPGVYVIDDGDFSVSGQARVRGDDVTIILTAWDPSKKTEGIVGSFVIAGGADVQLSAPDDPNDPYVGLLFVVDPEAPYEYAAGSPEVSSVAGGSSMNLTGAVYSPSRGMVFAGNSDPSVGGAACTQVIAKSVTMTGTSFVSNDPDACEAAGVTTITQTRVRVVE